MKIERIYRVLLSPSGRKRTWYRIAKDADTAYGWTHRVLSELQDQGVIKGSDVIEPERLFGIWAERRTSTRFREYHIQDQLKTIKNAKLDFALTTYYAEQLVGNYLFPRYIDLYIHEEDANKWHHYMSQHGYVGKGNVRILRGDEHVFWEANDKTALKTVSVQQLIVDLLREGGVCMEAAELLIEGFYGKK
jgi:hypothetical protein